MKAVDGRPIVVVGVKRARGATAGHSLVELLLVFALIGLLASLATPWMIGAIGRSRKAAATADMRTVADMLELYDGENGRPPPALGALPGLVGSGVPQGIIYRQAPQIDPQGFAAGGESEPDRWAPPGVKVYRWELRTTGDSLCPSCPNENGGIGVPFVYATGGGGPIRHSGAAAPNPNLGGSGGESLGIGKDPCTRIPLPPGCEP